MCILYIYMYIIYILYICVYYIYIYYIYIYVCILYVYMYIFIHIICKITARVKICLRIESAGSAHSKSELQHCVSIGPTSQRHPELQLGGDNYEPPGRFRQKMTEQNGENKPTLHQLNDKYIISFRP